MHPMNATLAPLAYMHPPHERPYNYATEPPAGTPWENYERDARLVSIRDGRADAASLSVDVEGIALFDAPGAPRDFSDEHDIVRNYYPEVAALACLASGASRAVVFDHLVRRAPAANAALGFGGAGKGQAASANACVHNDYTEASGRRRLGLVLGDAAAQVDGKRYAILNIWRSIAGPVLDTPLAVCDARSVDARDLVQAEVRYPRRVGEIYLARFSPRHRWLYFSALDTHEALVFKQYDSQLGGVARWTPHAAFRHPEAPAAAPPRVSIEARCIVIYD